mmetsp:Transcript_50715/g.80402  ORF Transcript_50715/g.80402 Transcript_50715/m.80402 type:complete len:266 (+) Transcript_50715:169-966(+)
MDTDAIVEVLFGATSKYCDAETLNDFSSVGAKNVAADNLLVLGLVCNDLEEAIVAFPMIIECPLQRLGECMINLDVVFALHLDGFFFTVTNGTILYWCEDGGADIHIIHELRLTSEQPVDKQTSCLDSYRRQLWHSSTNVTDSEDAWHICGVIFVDSDLAIFVVRNSNGLQVEPASATCPSNRDEDSIINVEFLIVDKHLYFAICSFLEFRWDRFTNEFASLLLHILTDSFGALFVKASEKNRAYHDSRVKAKGSTKACSLESNI